MEIKDTFPRNHAEHVKSNTASAESDMDTDIVENYLERYSKFYSKFNLTLIVVSGIVMSVVYVEVGTIGYILPISQCELQWTMPQKGVLGTIGTAGVIFTSHFWGFMADTKGRKAVILPTLFTGFVFSFLSTLSNSFWVMFLFKLLNGFCVSASSATIYAYIGEFHSNKTRDTAILASSIFAAVGCVIMPIFAALIMNQEWSFHVPIIDINYTPWRFYMFICAIPGLICAIVFLYLPESPKFLLTIGKEDEAIEVLQSIYKGEVKGALLEKSKKPEIPETSLLQSMWDQTVPLFQRSYILITFLICAINFFCFATASGMYIWFPDIVNSVIEFVNQRNEGPGYMCEIYSKKLEGIYNETKLEDEECITSFEISTYMYGAFLESGYMIGYLVISMLINCVSGKLIMWTMLMMSGVSGLVAVNIGSPMLSVYLFILLMTSALAAQIVNSSTISLYPTNLRGMAINIGLMFGRIGAVFGSSYIGSLLRDNCEVSFYVSGISLIVSAFLALLVSKPRKSKNEFLE